MTTQLILPLRQLQMKRFETAADVIGNAVRVFSPEHQPDRLFLLRYAQSLSIQTEFTALANARSNVEQRLARWLLMCADRVHGDHLNLTHEYLSIMLGIRRPGVTVAIQLLEGNGLIRANRGVVIVRDRGGLVAASAGSYGVPEAEYERLIGKIAGPAQGNLLAVASKANSH
ncbi:Crp/Fnr family transcriptional regulator [Mesorhizobium sp. WSM2239]|uniref:Crp/Fnr family transcriptional regulator n=2 Tax=unclassified Mesorhizobium TaxID=325217 RepID=A0AAU8D5R9_9HYPH